MVDPGKLYRAYWSGKSSVLLMLRNTEQWFSLAYSVSAWTLWILKASFCIFSSCLCASNKKKQQHLFSGVFVCVSHRKNSQGLEASDQFRRIARAQVKMWVEKLGRMSHGKGLKLGVEGIWRIMDKACWRQVAWVTVGGRLKRVLAQAGAQTLKFKLVY